MAAPHLRLRISLAGSASSMRRGRRLTIGRSKRFPLSLARLSNHICDGADGSTKVGAEGACNKCSVGYIHQARRVRTDEQRPVYDELERSNRAGDPRGAGRTAARHSARRLLFAGPAVIASIAYMDPGNFATNIQAGAQYGYALLWVVLLANVIAMLFQALSAKLGIVTGRNLAELCRDHFPRPVVLAMWVRQRDRRDGDRPRRIPRRRDRPVAAVRHCR